MFVTEEEARAKWCPFARVVGVDTVNGAPGQCFNRVIDEREVAAERFGRNSYCIGSMCMAWRRAQKRNPDWTYAHHNVLALDVHPDDKKPLYVQDDQRGYCGLAGKP